MTDTRENFEQDDRSEPSPSSMGEMVAKALLKGAAFAVGMTLGGPVGGLLALIFFGGGDSDGDVGV